MKPKRAIVVDASVMRAASADGGAPAPHCMGCLTSIEDGPFVLAINETLLTEWGKHSSRVATTWQQHMFSRRRTQRVREDWAGEIALIDAANVQLTAKQAAAVHKDRHLVALARVTNDRVLSLDDQQAKLLRALVGAMAELAGVHWVSPAAADAVAWLGEGAPLRAEWTLGAPVP